VGSDDREHIQERIKIPTTLLLAMTTRLKVDESREIVFHLARRLLWAKRELRKYDDPRSYYAMQQRYAVWMAFKEAQNCYRVAKMVLEDDDD